MSGVIACTNVAAGPSSVVIPKLYKPAKRTKVVEVLAQELPFEVESAPEPEPAPVVEVEEKEKEVPVEPTAVDRLKGWLTRMMKEVVE